ncbi:acetamidase/formamidase family protein [Embleya sp. NBC_00896]|uniref:acetamidase/formamidase family protein n=1 Tax=Embleya sp. NBC_00896 TaxID=2975961 RepID=UPI003869C7A5|nr:acetamidase/formamidase family protein [Embleya sp. NBC_00896]
MTITEAPPVAVPGSRRGRQHLPSGPGTVLWGWLPGARDRPVLIVDPGETLTVDTVSHEGILGEQGRDPVAFFGRHRIPADRVLADHRALAASALAHDPVVDGPHVVTGPIAVAGSRPGDLLAVHLLDLRPRTSYGVLTERHGRGRGPAPVTVCPIRDGLARVPATAGELALRLRPSLAVMGVATSDGLRRLSTRVGSHGGNLDLPILGAGTTLYLPVQTAGALLYLGGPRYAHGHGAAVEGPLKVTLRVEVVPYESARIRFGAGRRPFATTADALIPLGIAADPALALRQCGTQGEELLAAGYGLTRDQARTYMGATAEYGTGRTGLHARVPLPE